MADPLTSAIFATIVTTLSKEALKQYALITGLTSELQKLSDSCDLIQGVLYDAEAKQWNSGREGEAVKTWLRLLKDVAYDVDDVLDEFDIRVNRRQHQSGLTNQARSFFSLHHNPIAFRLKMADKLKSVRERLDAIYVKRPPGLNVGSPTQGVLEWRLTTSLVDDSEICGRVDEKSKLIDDLISSSKALSVHAVCGMGGLGKTTLAQLVYNAETIKTHFPLRMWVCVSDNADIKSLTRAIIGSCSNNSDEKEELESLQQRLSTKLGGERFLLVLDDVWENFPDMWDRSKNAINSGATGSVVLITTRIQQVAEKMRTVSICNMGRLSDDDSWSLFAIHAFIGEEHETFKKICKGIVKKCGGVPLVLKVLGSMLQLKKQEHEWLDVMESELWDLADEGEKILATLRLSYTHLPMNLRQCFSYCCIYPKDYVMEKEELIQLWMANDFIYCGGRKSLHERGKEIFSELVARSFFQNVEIDCWGNTTCKMHDLLHDVAKSVMGHEIHLIQPDQSLDGAKKYRHVSVSSDENHEIDEIKVNSKIPSLRSFIVMKEGDWDNYGDVIKSVEWLSTQKYLRILRCEKLPTSLSKHLRYLDVSGSSIKRLPESVSSLYKLQTLNLRDCNYLKWLPKDMKEMKNLVYLDIRGCNRLKGMPPGMGQLKGMRKLSKFIVGKEDGCKIGELKEMNGLEGELSISCLGNVKSVTDAESVNLMGKKMLTSLELVGGTSLGSNCVDMEWIGGTSLGSNCVDISTLVALQPYQNLRKLVIHGYESLQLPKWMMHIHIHLPNLVTIKLVCFTHCQQLQISLGRLDSLKELELKLMFSLKYIGEEVYEDEERAAFPSLEKLTLGCMVSLKEWPEIMIPSVHSSSSRAVLVFPRLRELSICDFPLMTKFPMIPSVQHLSIQLITTATSQVWVLIQANFVGLKSLSLEFCDKLESLPELDPQHNLCSLEKLTILACNKLQSLPSTGLWCSSSLRHLEITYCNEFITPSEDGLRHLTALQTLSFNRCPKMTSLPESIQHLTALQTLEIYKCEGLSCLPGGISSLTSLAWLVIYKCSKDLKRRCEKEKGEDWPKIAHIPSIIINWEQIR